MGYVLVMFVVGLVLTPLSTGINKALHTNVKQIGSSNYSSDGKDVYYGTCQPTQMGGEMPGYNFSCSKIHSADLNTFKPQFVGSNNIPLDFGIDNQHVYYKDALIENADPSSWEYIGYYFSKDKNHVYYENSLLPGADPVSFKFVHATYGYDNTSIFYKDKRIDGASSQSFNPSAFRSFYAENFKPESGSNLFYGDGKMFFLGDHLYKPTQKELQQNGLGK